MKKATSPMEAIHNAIDVMVESTYEDSEATDQEVALAYRRFENAIKYIASLTFDEKFIVSDIVHDIERLKNRVTELEVQYEKKQNTTNA